MAQFNGDLGWIATAPEDVAYGTIGIVGDMVYQHGISTSLKLHENRNVAPILSTDADPGIRLATWVEGSVTLAHTDEQAEVGDIYSHVASVTGQTYTFGGAPTITSLTYYIDMEGVEYDYTGCVVRGITWELSNSGFSTTSLDIIGQAVSKWGGSARSEVAHPTTEIITPGDLTTFTIGGTSLAGCLKGGTINWSWGTTDIARQRCGTVVIPQPLRVGRKSVTATFNLELDSVSNADTVATLDTYIADGAAVTIILDRFTLAGCKITGAMPDLATGLIDVALSVVGNGLQVVTAAA